MNFDIKYLESNIEMYEQWIQEKIKMLDDTDNPIATARCIVNYRVMKEQEQKALDILKARRQNEHQ